MNSNQAFEQIVLFSGFEYHRAIDYAQKNPKCPELWMATTHLLMIDWNKSNDGEYFVSNPQNLPKIQSH